VTSETGQDEEDNDGGEVARHTPSRDLAVNDIDRRRRLAAGAP
jgi:hypothetical protein